MEVGKKIHCSSATFWLDDVGLLHAQATPHVTLGLRDIDEHVAIFEQLCADGPRPLLVHGRLGGMTREARLRAASVRHHTFITAMAVVVDSAIMRMVVNVFIHFNQPPYPTQLFTDKAAARAWLETFLPAPATGPHHPTKESPADERASDPGRADGPRF